MAITVETDGHEVSTGPIEPREPVRRGCRNDRPSRTTVPNPPESEPSRRRNAERWRAFVECRAECVRTHDEEWSRRRNAPIDSRLRTANEILWRGDTEPAAFAGTRDRLRAGADQ